jgi:hypothetical protein
VARERVPLKVIQRRLGRVNPGVMSFYRDGYQHAEIIDTPRDVWRESRDTQAGLA